MANTNNQKYSGGVDKQLLLDVKKGDNKCKADHPYINNADYIKNGKCNGLYYDLTSLDLGSYDRIDWEITDFSAQQGTVRDALNWGQHKSLVNDRRVASLTGSMTGEQYRYYIDVGEESLESVKKGTSIYAADWPGPVAAHNYTYNNNQGIYIRDGWTNQSNERVYWVTNYHIKLYGTKTASWQNM